MARSPETAKCYRTGLPKSPFIKGGNYKELLIKSPFGKGGFRGI